MAAELYIERDSRVDGPVSVAELRARAAAGKLRPTDRVSTDRLKWWPASKVKGLVFGKPAGSALAMTETIESRIEHVPGYEFLGMLGKGACGMVFRARQVKLDRVVALKTVLTDRKPTPEALARFEKEAVSLAKLQHPNIVSVYDCGHHDGKAFFAMELLDGEDLADRLERTGRLEEIVAWHIARQTAAALAHAANLGIYHRDIKPANLYLVTPPTGFPLPAGVPMVKVTDFGLALTRQTGDEITDNRLTAAGVILGTPVYMPPEQFSGANIDQRADIYALGATLYHILSGKPPFDGGTIWEIMLRKSEICPRLGPEVSAESADLVEAMMSAKSSDRIGSYRELLERIDALPFMQTARGPITPRPTGKSKSAPRNVPARRGRAALYGSALVCGLLMAGGVVLGIQQLNKEPEQPPQPVRTGKLTVTKSEALFNPATLIGWTPLGGPAWELDEDEEKVPVMTGKGSVRRPFAARGEFRVVLGLDLHKAKVVEVVVAEGENATRWVVRIDQTTGAAFGSREASGKFTPIGNAVAVPTRQELEDEGRRPYLEVKYERASGKVRAWFRNLEIGEIAATNLKTNEVEIRAEGGPVRIDTVSLEEP